uniref:Peptidase M24 domain-containing protein n=1 Tax=Psilocybe cubensis TaxID=181762 RepID=A0A8H7Y5C0_PSICU
MVSKSNSNRSSKKFIPAVLALIVVSSWFLSPNTPHTPDIPGSLLSGVDFLDYSHLSSHCETISAIGISEYTARQIALAETLYALNASAYIAEPGANTHFYGNFSNSQWYLSERPLLLIISPEISESMDGQKILPRVTVLTPKFESARARMLPVPSPNGTVHYVEWAEEENPYAVVLSALPMSTAGSSKSRTIFVDNSIRKFIVDGLLRASEPQRNSTVPAVEVLSAPLDITQMRERKSEAELQILKCANEATLLAIREVHKNLYPGIRESQARSMMATALGAAGLKDGGCLTLFGENAALPHGSGTDRTLSKSDFALFDCTASLHGYYSDVTRTVALASAGISSEQLNIWRMVQSAQSIALAVAFDGTVTSTVDAAARAILELGGYRQYFTHRLGHGIGLEVHEPPYLRGGSNDIIRTGHTFSDEPGIYIEGKVGVRLEDCFYINEHGFGVYLTEGVGGQSKDPWNP